MASAAMGQPDMYGDMEMVIANKTMLCQNPHRFGAAGTVRFFNNPLRSPSSLFMLQLTIISLASQLFDAVLRPLGQSTVVSQILAGILLGPSLLGHKKEIATQLFPARGIMVFETFGSFGLMFFLFITGVKMDPSLMVRPQKKALTIGLSVFFSSLILPSILAFVLNNSLTLDPSLRRSIPFIAASQSLTGFPVIVSLLTELKIINTDIGRLALSASMFIDLVGISVAVVTLSILANQSENPVIVVFVVLSALAVVLFIINTVRPLALWMLKRTKEGKPVEESYILTMLVFVLLTGLASEFVGQHFIFGPLILGLVVPDGPPLGAALVSKVESLATGLFYPSYLAASGLQTNVFAINVKPALVIASIVVFGSIAKIVAVMFCSIFFDITRRDAFVLGLILNAKGIVELTVYNLWNRGKLLSEQEFALSVMSVIVVTAVVTPLIRYLYDPSKQYYSVLRSTIQHSKRDTEFRILVCVHDLESVPMAINLLEASYACEESNVMVIALILIELVARAAPVLIAHHPDSTPPRSTGTSTRVLNALNRYEMQNKRYAMVQSFTSVSHYDMMHDDIRRIAYDHRANIIILPFHKQWAIDGTVGSVNRSLQSLNIKVLEIAPCSVGILIDRGIPGSHTSVGTTSGRLYQVAIIFIGGPDDSESLAYGTRMARHPGIHLTLMRYLLFGGENSKERKRESELINEYRQAMGSERFTMVEEVVKDGSGLAASIKRIVGCFDLILVGRCHMQSQIVTGLGVWSECPELGVVGDMLASPDLRSQASVLVVQQQKMSGKIVNGNRKVAAADLPVEAPSRASWSITLEK